ncbi:MAG: hypothetical protein IPN93_15480 [Bacteroidetes bacterium]|jgi:hypothetical protein|nr:hypothetical protein [Bacteroidota bacterium]MBK7640878.1 hypothetical protein [Bacteroidota bacterium]MBK8674320.1 hypothetical protein [Bacteroidota bacterium]MBK9634633.1 hypothetical protein [Bacteroidota bacterium]MBL0287735.1 hypothetical protein [Bacteroidota bacterium]
MRKAIYSIMLFAILFNLGGCKKEGMNTPKDPINSTATIYDSVVGVFSGQHQYVDSNGVGDILTTATMTISSLSNGKYKVIISNIFSPYSFEISNGQKLGNVLAFDIGRQIYLAGPTLLYGDYSYIQSGQSVSLFYELDTKEIQYGIEMSNNGRYAGFHRGYYTKN